jgi:hypothetical protein
VIELLQKAVLRNLQSDKFDDTYYCIKDRLLLSWIKSAVKMVKFKPFQGAFAAVIKPNSSKTWKQHCFPCLDAEEIFLAAVIIQVSPIYAKIRQGFTKQVKARPNHTNCHACS